MKQRVFLVVILMSFCSIVNAQRSKSPVDKTKQVVEPKGWDVLVVGNNNAAFAAALQSANSGVKTTILLEAGGFDLTQIKDDVHSGIQAKFLKKYREAIKLKDDSDLPAIDKILANSVANSWIDSVKNLTVIRNVMWIKASRSGQHWIFKLSDDKTIRPDVLVNAGSDKLNKALEINTVTANKWQNLDYGNTIYRTSVASGGDQFGTSASIFSLYQFFIPQQENIVWISDQNSMLIGQAAGATAACAAFFTTKTSLSNLKKIQGELVSYKLNLLPFSDIKNTDTNWKAIQFVGVTGIIKGNLDGKALKFSPDQLITTSEVKQPIKDFFYKAQIWFDDYKDSNMTIGSTIDMVCYVGNKATESTKKELEKKWKTTYKFNSELDLSRQINRREFAVILQDYMPPFNVNIDDKGRVVR